MAATGDAAAIKGPSSARPANPVRPVTTSSARTNERFPLAGKQKGQLAGCPFTSVTRLARPLVLAAEVAARRHW